MNVVHSKIDSRYICKKYSLILCSTATSTLSWAISSKKPLIFINYIDRSPLTKDAYNSFTKGFFLFDYNNKNFHSSLLEFINLSLKDINKLWLEKKLYRQDFINDYISTQSFKNDFDF